MKTIKHLLRMKTRNEGKTPEFAVKERILNLKAIFNILEETKFLHFTQAIQKNMTYLRIDDAFLHFLLKKIGFI